jgi:uracil phosphoribosyltransferase
MSKTRLYSGYGFERNSLKLTEKVDKDLKELVSNLATYMLENEIDPQDFRTYCKETIDVCFIEKFIKLGIEQRKKERELAKS